MRGLISAIQFITVLPVGKPGIFDPKGMIPFFPVVGLIIGLLLCGFDMAVTRLWPGPVAAVLDVIFLVGITGALHLDGLGDAADGLYGHWDKERALAIMKDSRIGAMGLVAIVCCMAIKWGGIMSLDENRALLLIIVPSFARSSNLFGFRFLEYGRPNGGTGHAFFNDPVKAYGFSGLLIPMALSVFIGWKSLLLVVSFFIVTMAILMFYKKRIGCITGDMLGAMIEVTEALLFLFVSVRW